MATNGNYTKLPSDASAPKAPSHYTNVRELPKELAAELASVLAMPPWELDPKTGTPSTAWLTSQKERIAALPSSLLLPKGKISKLDAKLYNKALSTPPDTSFHPCDAHRKLHPELARDVFNCVADELVFYADRIRCLSRRHNRLLPRVVQDWAEATMGATGLWVEKGHLRQIAGKGLRLPLLERKCEACIVSVLMGRREVIKDVYAALGSRWRHDFYRHHKKAIKAGLSDVLPPDAEEGEFTPAEEYADKKAPAPRCLKLLTVWIDMLGPEEGGNVRDEGMILSDEILRIRKEADWLQGQARKAYWKKMGPLEKMSKEQQVAARRGQPSYDPEPMYTSKGHPIPHRIKGVKAPSRPGKSDHSSSKKSDRSSVRSEKTARPASVKMTTALAAASRMPVVEEERNPNPFASFEDAPAEEDYQMQATWYPSTDDYPAPGEYPPSPTQIPDADDMSPAMRYLDSLKDPRHRRAFLENDPDNFRRDFMMSHATFHDDAPYPFAKRDASIVDDIDVDENGVSVMGDDERDALLEQYTCRSAVPAGLGFHVNRAGATDGESVWENETVYTVDTEYGRRPVTPDEPMPAIPVQYAQEMAEQRLDAQRRAVGQTLPAPSSVYSQDGEIDLSHLPAPQFRSESGRAFQATARTSYGSEDGSEDEGTVIKEDFRTPDYARRTSRRTSSNVSPGGRDHRATATPLAYLKSQERVDDDFRMGAGMQSEVSTVLPDHSISCVDLARSRGGEVRDDETVVTQWENLSPYGRRR